MHSRQSLIVQGALCVVFVLVVFAFSSLAGTDTTQTETIVLVEPTVDPLSGNPTGATPVTWEDIK